MPRPPKVKYLRKKDARRLGICLGQYPNFHASGSITGMRKLFWGEGALMVRSGSYIYRVPSSVYNRVPD